MSELMLIPRIAALYELQSAYLEPKLRKQGMSFSTFQLLACVSSAGGDATQNDIARRLGISAATLSETVQVHVRKGLLEQTVSETDRRVKVLRLTKSANNSMKDIRKVLGKLEDIMVADIAGASLRGGLAVLDAAITNVEESLKT